MLTFLFDWWYFIGLISALHKIKWYMLGPTCTRKGISAEIPWTQWVGVRLILLYITLVLYLTFTYFSLNVYWTKIKDIISAIQFEIKREIGKLSWMDDDAKIQSKEKIDSMVKYISYPSWYDEVGKMDEYYDRV